MYITHIDQSQQNKNENINLCAINDTQEKSKTVINMMV